jgi:hypothetical protein
MAFLWMMLMAAQAEAAALSKNPVDWEESRCPIWMHYCPGEDGVPGKYWDGRPACPRGTYEWLKVRRYEGNDEGEGQCEAEFTESPDFYPVERTFHFPCERAGFVQKPEGEYVQAFVSYDLRHYPAPDKYSKLTDRYACIPQVAGGRAD